MAASVRRTKMIGHRRRVEDEGEDEAGVDHLDMDDDSMTDGSVISDDPDPAQDSDTSNVDEVSPTLPAKKKLNEGQANGHLISNQPAVAKSSGNNSGTARPSKAAQKAVADVESSLNNLDISEKSQPAIDPGPGEAPESPPTKSSAPIVVRSSPAAAQAVPDRRRKEHDEYRRKRDQDPAFVPNRGAFFMHDHRHAGPSANGFRPFGRGTRGGRGRGGGIGGPYAPINHPMRNPADPTVNAPWSHDMHEVVAQPAASRQARHHVANLPVANGDGNIPKCPSSETPINRVMSTERHVGNVQVRVFLPSVKEPILFPGMPVKQYTKLPDHRPPLRRDKAVRISLPNRAERFIFPAVDRSFIFIPRALRPNQQRLRGKPRSGFGSINGFSRRTSIVGGSYFGGSHYSPSIGPSRRSSITHDMNRDMIASPAGSVVSARPVVRLPPQVRPESQVNNMMDRATYARPGVTAQPPMHSIPQPQTHPLPQKPSFPENRQEPIPMHQPRPQKTVVVADIEPPAMQQTLSQPYQQAFHQQVPLQLSNGMIQDSHARHGSYPSQQSTGTPLSQIPERAIHAAPFQPNHFSQENYYPQYPAMQPQQQPQHGYYYPQPAPYPGALPAGPPNPGNFVSQPAQGEGGANQTNGHAHTGSNLVAQEANGMVYYYDASQLPPMPPPPPPQPPSYSSYPVPQGYPMPGGVVDANGVMTPTPPDGYYYTSTPVYYPQ